VNIAIDLRRTGEFGVGTYVRNIVRTLSKLDAPGAGGPDNRYVIVGTPDRLREFRGLPPNFKLQPFPKSSKLRHAFAFRQLLLENHCQLLHVPHLFKTPRFAPCPYVVTVHDLLGFLHSGSKQSPLESRIRFEMARWTLRNAARVVAVSNSTKVDLQRVFRNSLNLNKVDVIYNAIDERLLRGHATENERKFVAERYQVTSPFILYAGTIKPHKNVARVIEAFSALKTQLAKDRKFEDLKLLIIGDELSSYPTLRRTVVQSGVQNDVRFLGFVPGDVLRILYDTAKLFVFPSLYEGFGLPPLEAMAQGTPVVTSNTSSLPEVVGNAAVLVNPENVFEIMHALHRVLLDQQLRDLLKQRGMERARHFSWEESARHMLTFYEKAASGGVVTRA